MSYIIRKIQLIVKKINFWMYPSWCPFCGKILSNKLREFHQRPELCPECRWNNAYIQEPVCKKCGKPIQNMTGEYCYDCENKEHVFDQGRGLWLHKELPKRAVYDFKFHNVRANDKFFVTELMKNYGDQIRIWNPQIIMPVPLHPSKQKRRGYNQSELLARNLGEQMHIKVEADTLVRRHKTSPLKKLNDRQRVREVEKSFGVKKTWEPVNTVLLIDDIYTTGSTMDSLSRLLKAKGVQKVYFLTITIGQGF